MQQGFASWVLLVIGFLLLVSVSGGIYLLLLDRSPKIDSFEDCLSMGRPILESYPRRCVTEDGRSFTEKLSEDEMKKVRLPESSESGVFCIQVIQPAKNPKTLECMEFPTPCDVPESWEKVESCSDFESEKETYTACGCGCCGGSTPKEQCLDKSRGESIEKVKMEDQEAAKSQNCMVAGCSPGTKYKYCN